MLIRAIRDSARYSGDANTPDIEPTASNAFHPLRQSLKRKILYIYDARPLGNAVYNQVAGHGYEMPQNYDHCKVFFLSIENLHAVRKWYAWLALHTLQQLSISRDRIVGSVVSSSCENYACHPTKSIPNGRNYSTAQDGWCISRPFSLQRKLCRARSAKENRH